MLKNQHLAFRLHGKLLLLSIILLLTVSCTVNSAKPTDEEVWQALGLLGIAPTDEVQAITDIRIEQLGSGAVSVPEPQIASLCLPEALKQHNDVVRGESFLVRIVRRNDNKELATVDFTRWEGEAEWWISTPALAGSCLPLSRTQ